MLEPDDEKLSSPVLRRGGGGNTSSLSDLGVFICRWRCGRVALILHINRLSFVHTSSVAYYETGAVIVIAIKWLTNIPDCGIIQELSTRFDRYGIISLTLSVNKIP